MTQGAENDLLDIRFYQESTTVIFNRSNEPMEDINNNTLTIDNKAIAARDTAITVQTDLSNHIGQAGIAEHSVATITTSGFISADDKGKLDRIQDQAQLNILAPVDAIELISRKATTLHAHPEATTVTSGFMSATDNAKLAGIEAGAEVNNISTANVTTLTTGGNADALHTHTFAPGSEGFSAAVHATTNHTGLTGIPVFPGFAPSIFHLSAQQVGPGVSMHSIPYGSFTSLEVVTAGFAEWADAGVWGNEESFSINDITIVGTTGTVSYEIDPGVAFGDASMRVWQVGYGVV